MNMQLDIKQSLNKAFRKQRPSRAEIDLLQNELFKMFEEVNPKESEEYHKGLIRDFLKRTGFQDYFINTKDRSDLVIHNGKNSNSPAGVIIEIKRPGNKSEMPTIDNLNKKGMQELLLYFLRERITNKNIDIKHLIITNLEEWFVFDAKEFEKLAENNKLKKYFKDFEEGRLLFDKNEFFYKEIASPVLSQDKNKICFTYFNISEYKDGIEKQNKTSERSLIELQKIFSPVHLLKLPFVNDSNTLNEHFYNELLHIIGLEEYKEKSKKLIRRKPPKSRDDGSLLEAAIMQIDSLDKLSQIPNFNHFGQTKDEQLFNIALELVITWINRILFLKLLESQIASYQESKDYQFLDTDKVAGYDDLNTLFFQVLAIETKNRKKTVSAKFPNVPYLNSSLFEPTELEQKSVFINSLPYDTTLPLHKKTVVKTDKAKIKTLEYLFRFLDAYDFSSEGKEEVVEENKTLINASVLGLIFEKINGYKDGSFFTPGFITMYMCRETIRLAVIQKFKEQTDFDSDNFEDLINYTSGTYKKAEIQKYNNIINSLKICDPAVGSGHFLVSALNEIIAVKAQLGILADETGKPLSEYLFDVENDELTILDSNSEFFRYNPKDRNSLRVQKTIFHEKQMLIENCLFGVDINPNSVKICQLRLWIELLKNAYYKADGELETLPNIDINIKCGNSLISRYPLDTDLKQILKESKFTIEQYRGAVNTYRNAINKEQKRDMLKIIDRIRKAFKEGVDNNHPLRKKRAKLKNQLNMLVDQGELFELETKKSKQKKIDGLAKEINAAEAEINELENGVAYENSFEWRFEFPEVLNSDGDYIGFDAVIGNPPYGVSIKKDFRDIIINCLDKVPDFEIYYFFIELAYKICRQQGVTTYITPNTILFNVFALEYRKEMLEKWGIDCIADCTDFEIFEKATVRNIIFTLIKDDALNEIFFKNSRDVKDILELLKKTKDKITKNELLTQNRNWGLAFKLEIPVIKLIAKINKCSVSLSDNFPNISQGLIAYDKYQGQSEDTIKNRVFHYSKKEKATLKPWLWGQDVTRYRIAWNEKEYIDYCDGIANPRQPIFFRQERILIREITNPRIYAGYTEKEMYNDPAIINILKGNEISLMSLLGILNSKLMTFYHFNSSPKASKGAFPKILVDDVNRFPLIPLDNETEKYYQKIDFLVNKMMQQLSKATQKTATDFYEDKEIDSIVYKLYGLTDDEIAVIENSVQ